MAPPGPGDPPRRRWVRWSKPQPVEPLDPQVAEERDAKAGRSREPERVGRVVRGILGEAELRHGLALGRLLRRWEEVVGSTLDAQTAPTALDRRGLVVAAASSAWATQVTFLASDIQRRANAILGREEVASVRSVVDPRAIASRVRSGPRERPEGGWPGDRI